MNLIWLPGWQCSHSMWQPLLNALANNLTDADSTFVSYGEVIHDRQVWLKDLSEKIIQPTIVIGWSLGGMLGCELAAMNCNIKHVIVINANTKFSGDTGLPDAIAKKFMARYQTNKVLTLGRFAQLVDAHDPNAAAEHFLTGDHLHTLQWLYEIDLNSVHLSCPVDVCLASNDQLVPCEMARDNWASISRNINVINGQHSTPLADSSELADWLVGCGVSNG